MDLRAPFEAPTLWDWSPSVSSITFRAALESGRALHVPNGPLDPLFPLTTTIHCRTSWILQLVSLFGHSSVEIFTNGLECSRSTTVQEYGKLSVLIRTSRLYHELCEYRSALALGHVVLDRAGFRSLVFGSGRASDRTSWVRRVDFTGRPRDCAAGRTASHRSSTDGGRDQCLR